MSYSFRLASRQDIAAVLVNETTAYEMPWGKQALIDSLNEQYQFWVIESRREQKIIGHLIYQVILDESHLLNICVHPREQGKGLGKATMDFWVQQCLIAGCKELWLEVRSSNTVAQKMYQSLNFKAISTRKNYYPLPGNLREDGLIMSRNLPES
ncbi:MAG: ribosomal protein S18-alanine N-acetyltransferase [Gammaproteobacteria bacterium]|nr:ribosomal protein S18-alanine N-acetyltransferase [Gammaproteobacteria bacterium]